MYSSYNKITLVSVSLCIVFLGVGILQSCVYYRSALEEEYRKRADEAYSQKEYATALEYYSKIQSFVSKNNTARYRMAEIHIRLGNYDEARKELDRLLRDKKNVLAQELDAYWYFAIGDIEEAILRYQLLLDTNPYNTRILSNLGIIYQREGRNEESLRYFNNVLDRDILSIQALESYIRAIYAIESDTDSDTSISMTDLSAIIKHFLDALDKKEITLYEMNEIVTVTQSISVDFVYPLYLAMANYDYESNDADEKIVIDANFKIALLIFSQAYTPLDTEPLETALFYLEKAIALGFGSTKEELRKLNDLKENYLNTEVLLSRVMQIYHDAEIISVVEYENFLSTFEENTQDISLEESTE